MLNHHLSMEFFPKMPKFIKSGIKQALLWNCKDKDAGIKRRSTIYSLKQTTCTTTCGSMALSDFLVAFSLEYEKGLACFWPCTIEHESLYTLLFQPRRKSQPWNLMTQSKFHRYDACGFWVSRIVICFRSY